LALAVEYGELGLKKAPTPGDKAWAQGVLAWAMCRAGEPRRGSEILAQIVPVMRAVRFAWAEIIFRLFLGEAYWRAGDYDQAKQTLEDMLEVAQRCQAKFIIGAGHRLLGEVAMAASPAQVAPALAGSHFEKSIAILREIKAENELALAYAGYGRLRKQQGKIADARDYLTRALELFERLGTLTEPDKVRAELGALSVS